jgi:hypothetical protein
MSQCSLLVPTHRDGKRVRVTLANLAAFGSNDVRVIFADNSESRIKHDFLHDLTKSHDNVEVYPHAANIGSTANFAFLLEQAATSEFVQFCADDDTLTLDCLETSLSIIRQQPGASSVAGHLLALHLDGNCTIENRAVVDDDLTMRLRSWFQPSSWNLPFYSLHRRSFIEPWLNFIEGHPMVAPFFDFLFTSSLIAQGPFLRHGSGAYLWRADNWDDSARNAQTRMNAYQSLGMSKRFMVFFDLHFAVEAASFFLGKHSPVDEKPLRLSCAAAMWEPCLQRFRLTADANEALIREWLSEFPGALMALNALYDEQSQPCHELLALFPILLEAFSEHKAREYHAFQTLNFSLC